MRILVVEDDENSRALQHTMLESAGYDVLSADNGQQALELVHEWTPDLIISDLLMPVMDGFAFCRALRKDPALRDIPLIFYTATFTNPDDERLAFGVGATKFLLKPMDPEDFLAEVQQVLQATQPRTVPAQPLPTNGPVALQIQTQYADALSRKLSKKIADLELSQRDLAASERKYRRLAEALHRSYFFYSRDAQNRLHYISPSVTQVLGCTPAAAQAGLHQFMTDCEANRRFSAWQRDNALGEPQPMFTAEFRRPDGALRYVELTEQAVMDPSGHLEMVEGIAHDITDNLRLAREKAEMEKMLRYSQKEQALGTLASGIAHDFNNILTSIMCLAEMIRQDAPADTPTHGFAAEIVTAGRRAADLIAQIKTFGRRQDQPMSSQAPAAIVEEALRLVRATVSRRIEIRTRLDGMYPEVLADSTQLHQVVVNLCTNAYQAMREKGGVLQVALDAVRVESCDAVASQGLAPGEYVRLEVSDTGCGMTPEVLDRIFEPYFTTKDKDEGTGLGLAVVQGIVRSHGGFITVYSAPGSGTTFHVYLPAIQRNHPPATAPLPDPVRGHGEMVLVVGNEISASHNLATLLETLGYRASVTLNSRETLELVRQAPQRYQLVIADLTMPDLSGVELAQELLAVRPDLPIVVCTWFSGLIQAEKTAQLGIRGYLKKPVLIRELAQALQQALAAPAAPRT